MPEGEPVEPGVVTNQSSLTAAAVISSAREFDWSEWAVSAHWTGAVVASATFSVDAVPGPIPVDEVMVPACREVVPLVRGLGGYGPAHLNLVVRRASEPTDEMIDGRFVAPEQQPQPPRGSLFERLPEGDGTVIGRWVSVEELSGDILASMERELERAAGRPSFEPEEPPRLRLDG